MYSCHVFSLLIILYVGQFSPVELKFVEVPNHSPFLDSEKIPQDTPWPINIDTKNVKYIKAKPLFFNNGLNEKWRINQTGQSVEVLVNQPCTVTAVTGGVLQDDTYRFHKFRFYWHDNTTSAGHYAASTVDGKRGAQLEAVFYYYNEKYGSFRNALNYRDGLVEVSSRINVGWFPNLLYCPFQYTMKKIKKPGDSTPVYSAFSYLWLIKYPKDAAYYAHPSSYHDEETGKTYACTTAIVAEFVPDNFISYQQFHDTFGSLVDSSGKPLINAVRQYPSSSITVVKSNGIIINNVFK